MFFIKSIKIKPNEKILNYIYCIIYFVLFIRTSYLTYIQYKSTHT